MRMDTHATVGRGHIFEQQKVGENTNHLQGNETRKTAHTVGLDARLTSFDFTRWHKTKSFMSRRITT